MEQSTLLETQIIFYNVLYFVLMKHKLHNQQQIASPVINTQTKKIIKLLNIINRRQLINHQKIKFKMTNPDHKNQQQSAKLNILNYQDEYILLPKKKQNKLRTIRKTLFRSKSKKQKIFRDNFLPKLNFSSMTKNSEINSTKKQTQYNSSHKINSFLLPSTKKLQKSYILQNFPIVKSELYLKSPKHILNQTNVLHQQSHTHYFDKYKSITPCKTEGNQNLTNKNFSAWDQKTRQRFWEFNIVDIFKHEI